jgi:hypothetical protein
LLKTLDYSIDARGFSDGFQDSTAPFILMDYPENINENI